MTLGKMRDGPSEVRKVGDVSPAVVEAVVVHIGRGGLRLARVVGCVPWRGREGRLAASLIVFRLEAPHLRRRWEQ